MKVTVGQLLAANEHGLRALSQQQLDPKLSFAIALFLRRIAPAVDAGIEARTKCFLECGGTIKGTSVFPNPDRLDELNEKLTALGSEIVSLDIELLPANLIERLPEKAAITPAEISTMLPFIAEEQPKAMAKAAGRKK